MVRAIKNADEGVSFFPSNLMEKVMVKFHELKQQQSGIDYYAALNDAGAQSLTRRELEVLQCIVDGMSNKECAEHLFISENS